MDPSYLIAAAQASPDHVMVWGIFSCHNLCPLQPNDHCINTTASLSIFTDHAHLFKIHLLGSDLWSEGQQHDLTE